MKLAKKLVSLLLAVMMLATMVVPALAEGNDSYTLTVKGNAGHTYEVYQIFTGDLSDGILANIVWGDGVTSEGQNTLGKAADKAKTLTTTADATAFGVAVAPYLTNPTTMTAGTTGTDGKVSYTATGLKAGYYLVKDKDNSQDGKNEAYTAYILKVVGNTTANAKDSVPTSDKSIVEGDDRVNATDKNIGDIITFELKVTLGDLAEYETYKLILHDTMSQGLTFQEYKSATLVHKDAENAEVKTDVKEHFTMAQAGQQLTFTCNDVIALGAKTNDDIIITYTAVLNADAEIGKPGNDNVFYVEYSNNPNASGTGSNDNTGKTPEDKVIVFTYELDVTKVDGQNDATKLQDAEFILYRGENNKEYAKVDANGKVTGWTTTKEDASTLKSDANGLFKVIGLDAGTYWLEETKAPAGYNLLEVPVKVVIKAELNTAEDQAALTSLKISVNGKADVDGNLETGLVEATVENNKGVTLPSTGGMGTTMLYVVGSVLVVGAAVMLITKRRMSSK